MSSNRSGVYPAESSFEQVTEFSSCMYKKISDYGIIGDLYSVALVGVDGSIDWMCMPYIDSPSIFAALLDDKKGGRFSLSPSEKWDSVAEYIPGTNILKTRFRTDTGMVELTDFMPVYKCASEGCGPKQHDLYRCIKVVEGKVTMVMNFEPRFDYAKAETTIEISESFFLINSCS